MTSKQYDTEDAIVCNGFAGYSPLTEWPPAPMDYRAELIAERQRRAELEQRYASEVQQLLYSSLGCAVALLLALVWIAANAG